MIDNWNQLLTFLADPPAMDAARHRQTAPLLILAGNGLPVLVDHAADLLRKKQIEQIFLVGGIGHATPILRRNFEEQGFLFSETLSESEMYRRYLQEKYHFSDAQLLVEPHSTNSGENAQFALDKLQELQLSPRKVLLMNDPILQRRTRATFEKVWENTTVEFENYVPIVPQLACWRDEDTNTIMTFTQTELNYQWPSDYFKSLVLGEIARLHDDEYGYGPKGKGYLKHIEIPAEIWTAYQAILSQTKWQFSRT
ncbi:YdcF family protein [Candidatus Enterococcus courvalinii]|uniref:YdcF family protein n=1 Tax=Candidatus Enterococcus courvalinii TaxID=2815329 RepID=A0ABS3HYE5_9ENTE|nr:YdcF family protein [Enterococcus sp. MSG2901]MBO0480942.1 YdcF family protein [Enterococcus sp. MSG2901]